MIRIVLVSNTPDKVIALRQARKDRSIIDIPTRGYKAAIEDLSGEIFVYFDYSSFSSRQKSLLLKFLREQEDFEYGIIDPLNEIEDPANLFHDGASDYIGKTLSKMPVNSSRVRNALTFYQNDDETPATKQKEYSWDDITPGNEYPFIMLLVEIDILPQWKTKSGKHLISRVMQNFYSHISRVFQPLGGKLWIHTDYGGLLLFPHNNDNSCIVTECVKMVINRVLTSCEIFDYDALITYRLSITTGETEYQEKGDTGTLISDSLNFIFHLGQRFTPKGNLIITEDMLRYVPDGIKDLFVSEAEFQGKQVYRLLQPVQ